AMTVVPGTGDIRTRQSFSNMQLHIEWRTPAEIEGKAQGRGNSGVILMERYEIQVLDSFKNSTYANGQAGSVYKQHIPLVNAARGPGEWQSYDIIFAAPRFSDTGRIAEPARVTVLHNGVLIQNNVSIQGPTVFVGAPSYEAHGAAPIRLQDHRNPVSFRNIWVRRLSDLASFDPSTSHSKEQVEERPNILLAISDDQSWPHASAYGSSFVTTPAFDRVAAEGVLFHNAFAPAPQCSPTRASILTGRNPWQNGDAAVHGTPMPADIPTYTGLLEKAGYHVGMTGKGWAPGPFEGHNPAGKEYGGPDYVAAFRAFLDARPKGEPFAFWYGAREPHRRYEAGSGLAAGKTLESVDVPGFLPDHEDIRSDLLDYALEIEHFDAQLGQMLKILEEMGELDDTIVVVTSDNGMPWSRAKANVYEYGVHMPLAIRWGRQAPAQREVTDLASLADLAPTFLEGAGLAIPEGVSGNSLVTILKSDQSGLVDETRTHVVFGLERHTPYVRENDVGYPSRGIRTQEYLYIRNFKPDRWPEGDTFYGAGPSSARTLYMQHSNDPEMQTFIRLGWAKRPAEELYDIRSDPDCISNLISNPEHASAARKLKEQLNSILTKQGDPRIFGDDHYDEIEYFKLQWKDRQDEFLEEAAPVHRGMEAAGWNHGSVGPLTKSEANE
ncbi:MAG: family 16 glycoside hydrolase, partial [Gammaproteobacteria bacterium]